MIIGGRVILKWILSKVWGRESESSDSGIGQKEIGSSTKKVTSLWVQ
jgi:hypothetical protein